MLYDMTDNTLKIALAQHAACDDPAATRAGLRQAALQAGAQGCRLLVLQELHNHHYFCQQQDPACFALAEPVPGPTTEFLGALAAETGLVIIGSVFEQALPGLYYNTAVVLERDGRLAGSYRKMHIPDDPGYQEKYYFAPGDRGFAPIRTSLGRLGVLVCWDQWFPEAARLMALAGAELLIYPTAIGWEPGDPEAERQRQLDAWITIQRSHAIANAVPVLCCNRTGTERLQADRVIRFWGNSFVTDSFGSLVAQAPADEEQLLVCSLDMAATQQTRHTWPLLRDRRIDAYQGLLLRTQNAHRHPGKH